MNAGAANPHNRVSRLHLGAVDHFLPVHKSNAKAGHIVFIHRIKAGHFRSLPADQGASGLDAALRNAGDDLGYFFRIVFSHGDIVQEKQRLSPDADYVVDAHGHAVDTDGIMLIQQKGNFQLCPHAVGAGNQNRLLHAGKIRLEQAAEAADTGNRTVSFRSGHMFFH